MEEKYAKERDEINRLITTISSYPIATSWKAREDAKKTLLKIYRKGDNTIKGFVLAYINEKLSNVSDYRNFVSIRFLREKYRQQNVNFGEVSKVLFDFSSSVEGACFFLSLLREIDDELSIKLLTFHLTRYMAQPGFEARLLSNRAVLELGKCNNPYALHCLLEVAEAGEGRDSFLAILASSLKDWKDKLHRARIPKTEKEFLVKRLDRLLEVQEIDLTSQYR